MGIKRTLYQLYAMLPHLIGRVTGSHYFEDFIRVYPNGIAYYPFGLRRTATQKDLNNFRNHYKFYVFAAQFVKGKRVADVGCGSGYGCELLKQRGAAQVYGCDMSRQSIAFAQSRYGAFAEFTRQSITDMKGYPDDFVDVSISSEVLEHIKEYGMEEQAILELKRITRKEGLLVVATPNSEMLGDHGFYFSEIAALFGKHFSRYCIFENAFVPFGDAKSGWERRLERGEVGIIVSELINLDESVVPEGVIPEIKRGLAPGNFRFGDYDLDTTLLHNTHSWVILGMNDK